MTSLTKATHPLTVLPKIEVCDYRLSADMGIKMMMMMMMIK